MTETYHVHLYREMRLTFEHIVADTPEAAAAIARYKPTDEADTVNDCDGESFAALVDVAGDTEYSRSVTVDFEPENQRRAAAAMLSACQMVIGRWEQGDLAEAARACHAAVALATGGCPPWDAADAPAAAIDIDALLAERRQVADIWSIADVQAVRPDLSDDQAWEVLQRACKRFDAAIGNHWEMLAHHAEEIAGPAPEDDEA